MEQQYTEKNQEQTNLEQDLNSVSQDSEPITIAQKQDEVHKQVRDKEENFRRMQEKHASEKKALSDKVNKLEQQLRSNNGLSDDDIVEGRHLAAIRESQERLEKELREQKQKHLESIHENQLKSEIPDIYEIVNAKNLERLKESDPALYSSIASAPDLYTRGKLAHTLIKQAGFMEQQQNNERIDENLQKPGIGKSPGALSKAESYRTSFSDEEKKAKWAEIQKYISG